jgi:hypothetical protein
LVEKQSKDLFRLKSLVFCQADDIKDACDGNHSKKFSQGENLVKKNMA